MLIAEYKCEWLHTRVVSDAAECVVSLLAGLDASWKKMYELLSLNSSKFS